MEKRYETNELSVEIGNRIRELRKKTRKADGKSMNQEEFLQFLDCDNNTSRASQQNKGSQLENGYKRPSFEQLIAMSQKCGVSIDWILTGNDSENCSNFRSDIENTTPSVSEYCRKILSLEKDCNPTYNTRADDDGNTYFTLTFWVCENNIGKEFESHPPTPLFRTNTYNSAIDRFLDHYYKLMSLPIDQSTKDSLVEALLVQADRWKAALEKPAPAPF